jgi:hypothetical protein
MATLQAVEKKAVEAHAQVHAIALLEEEEQTSTAALEVVVAAL